jgi:acyl-CoA synthetase (AMP-forming)/AMP-acid ligase II
VIKQRKAAVGRLLQAPRTAAVLASTGVVRPYGPRRLAELASTVARWGTGLAGGYASLATRFPDEVGLVDERGPLTFKAVHRRTNALAHSLAARGVGEGDSVAIMCRNHRGFVEASVAAAKLGADVLYLNTAFAAPQIERVLEDADAAALVFDEEFEPLLSGIDVPLRLLAWRDSDRMALASLDDLIDTGDVTDLVVPQQRSRTIILTSGTTGAPKGANRGAGSLDAAAALLSVLPLRRGWPTHIAAPLFHTWGWAHFQLGLLLGSRLVLRRRFDPFDCLETVSIHGCRSLVVIPVMMQRVLELPDEVKQAFPLETVEAVAASGSALPGDLAHEWMDTFGDTLYNVYGSTECAWATIAAPADLRQAPGTAGRPPIGTVVRLLDDAGTPVPTGEVGRIFVGNSMLFEGYTSGDGKPTAEGLMATGDVGRFDTSGRLFVEGRDDDMIVSGGENVFPQEVEHCLARHPDVAEAAAVGVDDRDFGQRLRAFVVRRAGAEADEEALQTHVKTHLARYKVPRDVVFVDSLPRNSTGKVVKRDLERT